MRLWDVEWQFRLLFITLVNLADKRKEGQEKVSKQKQNIITVVSPIVDYKYLGKSLPLNACLRLNMRLWVVEQQFRLLFVTSATLLISDKIEKKKWVSKNTTSARTSGPSWRGDMATPITQQPFGAPGEWSRWSKGSQITIPKICIKTMTMTLSDIYTMFLDRATCSSFFKMFQNVVLF